MDGRGRIGTGAVHKTEGDLDKLEHMLMLFAMTPLSQCLRKVGHASAALDSLSGRLICEALNELEGAYRRPSERIVALEAVLHEFGRIGTSGNAALGRFLRVTIERRQNKWARQA